MEEVKLRKLAYDEKALPLGRRFLRHVSDVFKLPLTDFLKMEAVTREVGIDERGPYLKIWFFPDANTYKEIEANNKREST